MEIKLDKTKISALISANSLEEFLCGEFAFSKNKLKKFFPRKALSRPVKERDVLEIPLNLLNDKMIYPVGLIKEVHILFENDDYLVVNKTPNQHCHPLSYLEDDNLLSSLRESLINEPLNVNCNEYDRGLLYRLDYVTSGCLILAKKDHIYKEVRENFHKLFHQKCYLAICKGEVKDQSLRQYFKPYGPKGEKVIAGKEDNGGQLGLMRVELVEYDSNQDLSLVKVYLESGLRHQIRAGLAGLGHPLLGDELYQGEKARRVYLHAYEYRLEFEKTLSFKALNTFGFEAFFDLDRCL